MASLFISPPPVVPVVGYRSQAHHCPLDFQNWWFGARKAGKRLASRALGVSGMKVTKARAKPQ